eukprot:1481833-Lingulodinium_polyedra.AAC.1
MLTPFVGHVRPVHARQCEGVLLHLETLAVPGFDNNTFFDDLRALVLFIGAVVWSQLRLRFWNWPWKLLRA